MPAPLSSLAAYLPVLAVAAVFGLPFLLFPLERLWDEQAGYRWSRRTGALLADWDEDWTVVATQGADPFIH